MHRRSISSIASEGLSQAQGYRTVVVSHQKFKTLFFNSTHVTGFFRVTNPKLTCDRVVMQNSAFSRFANLQGSTAIGLLNVTQVVLINSMLNEAWNGTGLRVKTQGDQHTEILISNCEFSHIEGTGIYLQGSQGKQLNTVSLELRSSKIEKCIDGLSISNCHFQYCKLEKCLLRHCKTGFQMSRSVLLVSNKKGLFKRSSLVSSLECLESKFNYCTNGMKLEEVTGLKFFYRCEFQKNSRTGLRIAYDRHYDKPGTIEPACFDEEEREVPLDGGISMMSQPGTLHSLMEKVQ